MTFSGTDALADTRVYAQDTEPPDTRDGIIWVDTSTDPRATKVYSAASGTFEPVADIDWTEVSGKPSATQTRKIDGGYTVSRNGQIKVGDTETIQFDHYLDGVRAWGDRDYNWTVIDINGNTVATFSTTPGEARAITFEGRVIDKVTLENLSNYSDQDWSLSGHTPAMPEHTHEL